PAVTAGWPTTGSARASAEPVLNAWAGTLLGDPRQTRCTVEVLDAAGTVLETHALPLSTLSLAPLEVGYAVTSTPDAASASATTELEDRLLYQVRQGLPARSVDARLRVQHDRPGDLHPGELTLFDVMELARDIQALFAGARAATADDLSPAERASQGA